jgi:hypothetical protein
MSTTDASVSWRSRRTVPPGYDSTKPPSDPNNVKVLRKAFATKDEYPITSAMSAGFYFGSIGKHPYGFADDVMHAVLWGDEQPSGGEEK